MGIDASFCSNDHYRQWYQAKLDDSGLENVYDIERNQIHQSVLDEDYASFNTHAEIRDNINAADIFGWTALHLAAFLGLEEFVSGLVEAGSDALVKDCVGNMPIDLAGSEGYTKIVGFLAPITFVSEEKQPRCALKCLQREVTWS
jgi:ankyrin repeat protein